MPRNHKPVEAADASVQRPQVLLRMAMRLCRMGAWSVELPEGRLTLSDEARTIQEMPPALEPTVAEAMAYYAPECRATIEKAFGACVRDGTPFDLEVEVITPRGRRVWVRSIGEAERDRGGVIRRVQGAIQDISDRKQAADAARELARHLRATLDSITDAFLTMDRDWRFTFLNDEAERLIGKRADLLGRVAWEAFPEAVGSTFQLEYARARAENRTVTFEEFFPPIGKWFSIRAYPLAQGIAVYFRDVTETRRVADELRESERRFNGVMDSLNLVSMMLDKDGRITYANDYLLRLTGWARDEVVGRSWFEAFVPPESDLRALFTAVLAEDPEAAHHENEILVRGGGRRCIRWNNSVLRSTSGEAVGVASIGEDVTDHQRTEDQLRQAQKMEAVGRLAGGVAHDFNNSLGVILGYTELLLRKAGAGERGKLEQILKATQRASGLTRQLLAFSRRQIVDPKVLDLNALVRDLEEMLGRLIGENIELRIIRAGDLGEVRIDPGQLEQVVVNLCVNARDAMPDGGLLGIETANVELDGIEGPLLDPVAAGRYVMLAVTDAGSGIEKSLLPKIFEPFFTTKEEGKGTGLGLAMAYGVITQAGGYVAVDSEVGRGTTFRIYLPRIDEAVTRAAPEGPLPDRGWETVLLVEDESSLRDIAREMLEEHGYRVITAGGADDAIATAFGYPEVIHLLVTDVVMPGMNGRVLAESLVAARPGLKVLYMSGYTDDVIAHHGVLESGTLLVEKPFAAAAFLRHVRTALAS